MGLAYLSNLLKGVFWPNYVCFFPSVLYLEQRSQASGPQRDILWPQLNIESLSFIPPMCDKNRSRA